MSLSLSAVCYLKNLVVVLIIALMSFLFALLAPLSQPVLAVSNTASRAIINQSAIGDCRSSIDRRCSIVARIAIPQEGFWPDHKPR